MSLSPAPDHARANPLVSSTSTDQAMRSSATTDLGSDLDQVTIRSAFLYWPEMKFRMIVSRSASAASVSK
jgi:hypothetical protein